MNVSFVQHLIRVRMEKCRELLESAGCPSAESAALQIGYPDYPHFSKTFKKYFGVTPSEYRKQVQRQI